MVPLGDSYDSSTIEPLIGGLIQKFLNYFLTGLTRYWTPYRGIEMLICFPWKGSGGGVVYGCGVWRVKSWVKNVLNTNKYIAIFSIKWGWSRLTYLPLVFIISEKSIILFYWTPYRGIDTITDVLQFFKCFHYWTPYRGIDTSFCHILPDFPSFYWTPYRGIDTQGQECCLLLTILFPIEPLIGGLIHLI